MVARQYIGIGHGYALDHASVGANALLVLPDQQPGADMQGSGSGHGLPETGVWLDGNGPEFNLIDAELDGGQLEALVLDRPFDVLLPMPAAAVGGGAGGVGRSSFQLDSPCSDPQQPQSSSEEQKKEKLRLQNREKQQRFRQRQRERRQEMVEQFDATAAELERERAANATLWVATSTLEAVKLNKDFAVNVLQQAAAVDAAAGDIYSQQRLMLQSLLQHAQAGGALASRPAGSLSIQLHAMPFQKRVELCCRLFRSTEPALQTLDQYKVEHGDGGQVVDPYALDVSVQHELGDHVVAAHPQLLEALLSMSQEMMHKDWGEFCEFAAETMGKLDRGEISEVEAVKRMRPATLYSIIREAILLRHRPEVIRPLLYLSKLPGESDEAARDRWHAVSDVMGITREQAEQMLPHYLEFEERLDQLNTKSAASLETLHLVQQDLGNKLLQLDGGLSPQVAQYLDLVDAAGQLSSLEDARLYLLLDFYATTGAVVTELQKARLISGCRPGLNPDVPTIVQKELLRYGLLPEQQQQQAQQPQAQQIGAGGKPSAAGKQPPQPA